MAAGYPGLRAPQRPRLLEHGREQDVEVARQRDPAARDARALRHGRLSLLPAARDGVRQRRGVHRGRVHHALQRRSVQRARQPRAAACSSMQQRYFDGRVQPIAAAPAPEDAASAARSSPPSSATRSQASSSSVPRRARARSGRRSPLATSTSSKPRRSSCGRTKSARPRVGAILHVALRRASPRGAADRTVPCRRPRRASRRCCAASRAG